MDTTSLDFYYSAIAFIGTFLIYYYVLRKGYILHVMQPLGNIGKQEQTIESVEDIKDSEGKVTGKTTKTIKITGDSGVYHEVAKKKVSYKRAGTVISLFEIKGQKRLTGTGDGKSYLIDNSGVSYLHWRNRHIYLDSESMMPIKLQAGQFKPSSKLWYMLFDQNVLAALHKATSSPPTKTKSSTTTLFFVFLIAFAMGYFVALLYGGQLSGSLLHPVQQTITNSTSISSAISNITSTTVTAKTTVIVSNSTTITRVLPP